MNGQDLSLTKKLIDKYGGGEVSDSQLNSALEKKIADGTIASGEQLEDKVSFLEDNTNNIEISMMNKRVELIKEQYSGETSQRPLSGLYVGSTFFDTSLSKPIWCKSTNPIVWVDSNGTIV